MLRSRQRPAASLAARFGEDHHSLDVLDRRLADNHKRQAWELLV